jgi:UTP--glucose-1-phosphate uridylyltransferase
MIETDETTAEVLKRFRFDATAFDRMRSAVVRGGFENSARLPGNVGPPRASDLVSLPSRNSVEGKELAAIGMAALGRGEVGVVVLAGGMATRFGGVVKAVVEVTPGNSFLRLKLADIQASTAVANATVPVFLLASFSTSDEIRRATRELINPRNPIRVLEQSVTLRLTPGGDIFHDALGKPSLSATGHGDLLPTLRASGALSSFRQSGGKLLLVSNVDNLAASLDPRVIGAHVRSGRAVTVEVVRKAQGDRGGVPVWVGDHLQIVEEFRLPEGFDGAQVPFFNTNTFAFDAKALDQEFDLEWFAVRRKVDGRDAIQGERLLGQVTAFLPTQFLVVEREGIDGRFLPVKDQQELARRMPDILALVDAVGNPLVRRRNPSGNALPMVGG